MFAQYLSKSLSNAHGSALTLMLTSLGRRAVLVIEYSMFQREPGAVDDGITEALEGTSEEACSGWSVLVDAEAGSVVEEDSGIAGLNSGTDGGWMGGDRDVRSASRLEEEMSERPREKS